MTYLLFYSKEEQSYTLIDKTLVQPSLIEKDAYIVATINAESWEIAKAYRDDYINNNHNP